MKDLDIVTCTYQQSGGQQEHVNEPHTDIQYNDSIYHGQETQFRKSEKYVVVSKCDKIRVHYRVALFKAMKKTSDQ